MEDVKEMLINNPTTKMGVSVYTPTSIVVILGTAE